MKNKIRKLFNLLDLFFFEMRVLFKLKWLKIYTYVWATACLMMLVSLLSQYGSLLKADITQDLQNSITFTGTVHPIAGFPLYDSSSLDPLKYSTAYIGNYLSYTNGVLSPSVEQNGSHVGVDVIVPTGTAVRSIANGVVIKSANQPYGFGNHVCVLHPNVPSFGNKAVLTNYVSCYSHMSKALVSKDELVTKGQVIGTSGDSGTATTPHLHFQIDKENAPFHPYWPFTSSEASALGYSFWEAVNHGLGKSNALAYTINPIVYTQLYGAHESTPVAPKPPVYEPKLTQFEVLHDASSEVGLREIVRIQALDEKGLVMKAYKPEKPLLIVDSIGNGVFQPASITANDFKDGVAAISYTPKAKGKTTFSVSDGKIVSVSSDMTITSKVVVEPKNLLYVYPIGSYEVEGDKNIPVSKEVSVRLKTKNAAGAYISPKGHNKTLSFSVSGSAKVLPASLPANEIEDGVLDLTFLALEAGSYLLTVNDGYQVYKVGPFVAGDAQNASGVVKFDVEIDSEVTAGQAEKVLIRALDRNGSVVTSFSPTSLVLTSTDSGARFAKSPLFVADFSAGKATTTVTFSREGTFVVEAQDGQTKGISSVITSKKPEQALIQHSNTGKLQPVFVDVAANHTHYAAIKYLKDAGVVSGYGNGQFLPDATVTRVEALKMLFSAMNISVFGSKNVKSFNDVSLNLWYAPYVAEAKKRRVVSGYEDGTFRPDARVSRIEALKMLVEVLGDDVSEDVKVAPFSDVLVGTWHANYAAHAKKTGLVNRQNTSFSPNVSMTRGELASMIYRALND